MVALRLLFQGRIPIIAAPFAGILNSVQITVCTALLGVLQTLSVVMAEEVRVMMVLPLPDLLAEQTQELVVLVGREDAISAMVNNNHIARRYTALCQRLGEIPAGE